MLLDNTTLGISTPFSPMPVNLRSWILGGCCGASRKPSLSSSRTSGFRSCTLFSGIGVLPKPIWPVPPWSGWPTGGTSRPTTPTDPPRHTCPAGSLPTSQPSVRVSARMRMLSHFSRLLVFMRSTKSTTLFNISSLSIGMIIICQNPQNTREEFIVSFPRSRRTPIDDDQNLPLSFGILHSFEQLMPLNEHIVWSRLRPLTGRQKTLGISSPKFPGYFLPLLISYLLIWSRPLRLC